ncbi:MAG: hypothetical protein PHS53_04360 [Candidatus Pacebacteria bacterium]|nr:hypothetical protein [Candidatus Paceibacterota bacterium]MDD5357352.1 hypothetical protein [Candidatus Paceibacterota bacterium]
MTSITLPSDEIFSHWLAYGGKFSPDTLRANLEHSKRLGYGGMVIVPALIPPEYPPAAISEVFADTRMKGIACLFNKGSGKDPLNPLESDEVLNELRLQMPYSVDLSTCGLGPSLALGPAYVRHVVKGCEFRQENLCCWMGRLRDFGQENQTRLAIEILNNFEDPTVPNKFRNLREAIRGFEDWLGFQVDTGHWNKLGFTAADILEAKAGHLVWYLELVNGMREPLEEPKGVPIWEWIEAAHHFPALRAIGVEPFDPENVVKPFGLDALCQTRMPGSDCLVLDARTLRMRQVMTLR